MRLAILAGVVVAAGVVMASSTARAQVVVRVEETGRWERHPSGIELGLRTGYALPIGNAVGGANGGLSSTLSDLYNGVVPIWIDAGYRINPHWYVGAFFQYGIGLLNENLALGGVCNSGSVSCTGSDIQFGVDAQYHFTPRMAFDPWIGVGAGYEIASASASASGTSASGSYGGPQFFNVQLGGDFKAMRDLGVGPFVMFSTGEYTGCSASAPGGGGSCSVPSTALHEWFTFGVRGEFDIYMGP